MRWWPADRERFCLLGVAWLALCASMPVHADGMQQAGDGLVATSAPVAPPKPVLNHPFVYLRDGRLFAAGGMATSYLEPGHALAEESEIWDPQTDQWQALGSDLGFRASQSVSLNQLADGRVLLFAVDDDVEKPQYQARIWDPGTGAIEKLALDIKARRGSDVVVMADGRVLIVNGNEGAADVWDSRNSSLAHNEVPEIENARWKGVALEGGKVLLVEAYPGDGRRQRKGVSDSMCLLWDPAKNKWEQLESFPVTLRDNSFLSVLADGQVHAEVDGQAYQFSVRDNGWSQAELLSPPKESVVAAGATNAASGTNAASARPEQPVRLDVAANSETGQFGDIGTLLLRLQYAALAMAVPLLMYAVVWLKRLKAQRQAHTVAVYLYPVVMILLVVYVAWMVYWLFQEGF
ncbi:MAG TPA: hypothetical protein VIU93_06390 [Gallionellaceae bacterium]